MHARHTRHRHRKIDYNYGVVISLKDTDRTQFCNANFQFSMTFNFNIFLCFLNIRNLLKAILANLVCISCKIFIRWQFYLFLIKNWEFASSCRIAFGLYGLKSQEGGGGGRVHQFVPGPVVASRQRWRSLKAFGRSNEEPSARACKITLLQDLVYSGRGLWSYLHLWNLVI